MERSPDLVDHAVGLCVLEVEIDRFPEQGERLLRCIAAARDLQLDAPRDVDSVLLPDRGGEPVLAIWISDGHSRSIIVVIGG